MSPTYKLLLPFSGELISIDSAAGVRAEIQIQSEELVKLGFIAANESGKLLKTK